MSLPGLRAIMFRGRVPRSCAGPPADQEKTAHDLLMTVGLVDG